MADAGVMLRTRRGRATLWAPNSAFAAARTHAAEAFARQPTVAANVHAVEAAPARSEKELDRAIRRSARRPREVLPGLVPVVERMGFLEAREAGHFAPAKVTAVARPAS